MATTTLTRHGPAHTRGGAATSTKRTGLQRSVLKPRSLRSVGRVYGLLPLRQYCPKQVVNRNIYHHVTKIQPLCTRLLHMRAQDVSRSQVSGWKLWGRVVRGFASPLVREIP